MEIAHDGAADFYEDEEILSIETEDESDVSAEDMVRIYLFRPPFLTTVESRYNEPRI